MVAAEYDYFDLLYVAKKEVGKSAHFVELVDIALVYYFAD